MSKCARLPWVPVVALSMVVTLSCDGSVPLLTGQQAGAPGATVPAAITPAATPAPQLTATVTLVPPTPTIESDSLPAAPRPETPSPAPSPTAPPNPAVSPTPTTVVLVVATNAGGGGAGLYRATTLDDPIQRLPIATQVTVVGADRQADGKTWKNVEAPDGTVGWMPAEYLVPLPGTAGTPPAAPPLANAEPVQVNVASVVGGPPGGTAQVTVQTTPGAACAIEFVGTDGTTIDSADLLPRVARDNGQVSWSWTISPEARTGSASVTVMCNGVRSTAPISIGVQPPTATPGAPPAGTLEPPPATATPNQ